MTTSLQRHLLLKLSKAQTLGEKGFTLIELLVVIIIIGILAAVALPSLLSQTDKARAAEGKSSLGAINRAQQAYYLEKGSFSTSATTLGTGANTNNFTYTIGATSTAVGKTGTPFASISCTTTLTAPTNAGDPFGVTGPTCTNTTTNASL